MYKTLDTKTNSRLFIVRQGWLSPQYNLTDDADSYGTMSYSGLSRRKAFVKTAVAAWIFNWMGPFSRSVTITDQDGTSLGTASRGWFTLKVTLTLQTGFQAEFYRPSLWSQEYIWTSDGCGKILQIDNRLFSLKDSVSMESSMVPQAIIPLLIFLGEHLIILRRRRKAAH
jgi:hypothetical protein